MAVFSFEIGIQIGIGIEIVMCFPPLLPDSVIVSPADRDVAIYPWRALRSSSVCGSGLDINPASKYMTGAGVYATYFFIELDL